MDFELKGKIAFVGGSSAGIGRAVAGTLADEGCIVILSGRREDALRAVADEMRERTGVTHHWVVVDFHAKDQVSAAINEVLKKVGHVDILVTNSGGPPPGGFDELDEERWRQAYQNTLMHVVRLARGFVPGMQERKWGRIINITSISVKEPVPNLLLSNAFRAAVTGLAKTLSRELGRNNITVNNVAPGYTDTDRLRELLESEAGRSGVTVEDVRKDLASRAPLARLGQPSEIAALVAFLASESASYISGATIPVDGGLLHGLL